MSPSAAQRAPAGAGVGDNRGGARCARRGDRGAARGRPVLIELVLDPADGAGVSWLHRHTEVLHKGGRREDRPYRHDGARRPRAKAEASARAFAAFLLSQHARRGQLRLAPFEVFVRADRLCGRYFLSPSPRPRARPFRRASRLRRLAARRQRMLDRGEPPLEFQIGLAQRRLGIGVEVAREIDDGEQEIADFGR